MGDAPRHDGLQPLGRLRVSRRDSAARGQPRATGGGEGSHSGIPVAKVTFNLYDNDKKLIEFGKNKTMEVMWAAGAQEVVQEARYAHLVGAARMGSDPATSVVDQFGRTHDIANLFICDGSIMPTQGSANPGLTIMALAARIADYLVREGDEIFQAARVTWNRHRFVAISRRPTHGDTVCLDCNSRYPRVATKRSAHAPRLPGPPC